MYYSVNLFAESPENMKKFLELYYKCNIDELGFSYKKSFDNPVDMIELISVVIDNNDKFNIGTWINIDKDVFINITENNLDKVIRYLLERYPN